MDRRNTGRRTCFYNQAVTLNKRSFLPIQLSPKAREPVNQPFKRFFRVFFTISVLSIIGNGAKSFETQTLTFFQPSLERIRICFNVKEVTARQLQLCCLAPKF